MDIFKQITELKEALDGSKHIWAARYLKTVHLKDGRRAYFRLMLIIEDIDEDDYREYLKYKREIMEMDEKSAAKQKRPEWALDGYGHCLEDTNTDG